MCVKILIIFIQTIIDHASHGAMKSVLLGNVHPSTDPGVDYHILRLDLSADIYPDVLLKEVTLYDLALIAYEPLNHRRRKLGGYHGAYLCGVRSASSVTW